MVPKNLSILILIFLYSGILNCSVTALLDKAGQEIIEIRNPLKDLPTELEEEPSVEREDVSYQGNTITSTTLQTHTKKDVKTKPDGANRRMSQKSKAQEDEARIEKELAELYKDSDYKTDNEGIPILKSNSTVEPITNSTTIEVTEETISKEVLVTNKIERTSEVMVVDKPIARAKEFKFQPDDINNKAEVEKFRTSMDDIVCDRQFTTEKMSGVITPAGDGDTKSAAGTYDPDILLFLTIPFVARLTNY